MGRTNQILRSYGNMMGGQTARYGNNPNAPMAAAAPAASNLALGEAPAQQVAPVVVGTAGGGLTPLLEQQSEARNVQTKLRQVGSKTFYFKANRWIDSTVMPEEDAKAKLIRQFSDEFFHLARSQSAELNQYLTFTEPVTIKLAGTVYRIDPAGGTP